MNLKELRQRPGQYLTQKKVADYLGISQPDYANIENGRRRILEQFYGQKIGE